MKPPRHACDRSCARPGACPIGAAPFDVAFAEVVDTDVYDALAGPDLDAVAGELGVFRGGDDDARLRLRLRLRRR